VRELRLQHRKLFVDVTSAGDELALLAPNVRERAEPVVLQLEDPVGVIEGLGDADQRHGPCGGEHAPA
jgi:hypothetical protein